MYANGSPVTLKIRKTHKLNDSEQLEISAGILGLISTGSRSADGNHNYIVNFGSQGEWNCLHNELDGDDQEQGWDRDERPLQPINLEPIADPYRGPIGIRIDIPDDPPLSILYGPSREEEGKWEEGLGPTKIDPEADIARRMKELERK